MDGDWSLEGKGMKGYPDGEPTGFYTKEVLETLRKKLIERLKYLLPSCNSVLIEREINKIFGVK